MITWVPTPLFSISWGSLSGEIVNRNPGVGFPAFIPAQSPFLSVWGLGPGLVVSLHSFPSWNAGGFLNISALGFLWLHLVLGLEQRPPAFVCYIP